jgi:adenylate cyclase
MRERISLDELAALVNMPAGELHAWTEAGLLDPAGRGSYDDFDMVRLMTIRHYRLLGYDPDSLAKAMASGEVEPRLGEYLYPKGRELSIEEAADRLGVGVDTLNALRTALGFTRDTVLEDDLELFNAFKVMSTAGLPPEAALEGARVFGDSLRRLAETETRLVHVHIHERLEDEGTDEGEIVRQIDDLQAAVLPLLDGVVERVHHEHLLLAAIEDAYVHLVDTEAPGGRGSVDATIVFIDVESFTKLAEAEGDEAAMDAITRVDSAVRGLALDHDGKVVKQIGDALMLAFRQSHDAVRFAAELEATARSDTSMPALRIGMHCGPAIYRGGDYLGTTVNLASRVTGQATAGETLMTQAVADRADDDIDLEPVGVRMLRGAEQPLSLYRLRHQREQRDPVCGRAVKSPPAAQLQEDDEELWFCSKDCLRKYLASDATAR